MTDPAIVFGRRVTETESSAPEAYFISIFNPAQGRIFGSPLDGRLKGGLDLREGRLLPLICAQPCGKWRNRRKNPESDGANLVQSQADIDGAFFDLVSGKAGGIILKKIDIRIMLRVSSESVSYLDPQSRRKSFPALRNASFSAATARANPPISPDFIRTFIQAQSRERQPRAASFTAGRSSIASTLYGYFFRKIERCLGEPPSASRIDAGMAIRKRAHPLEELNFLHSRYAPL